MSDLFVNPTSAQSLSAKWCQDTCGTAIYDFIREHWRILVLIFTITALACIYPLLARSHYTSSADFHSAIKLFGAILGLIAGLVFFVQFNVLRNRFYLLVGLAFVVNGTEDLIQGILSFEGLNEITGLPRSCLERFIPGTHVTGMIMMGAILLVASFADKIFKKSTNPRRETAWTCSTVAIVSILMTIIAFKVPLPKFINPQFSISRPFDYFSAILLAVAFILLLQKYHRERDLLTWWILFSIGIHTLGQFMMSFSKGLHDAFFDIAHIYKIIGYTLPILGFLLYQIAIVNESKKAGEELQKAIEQIRKRLHSPRLKDANAAEQPGSKSADLQKDKEQQIRILKQQLEFILGVTRTGLDIIDSDFNVIFIDPEWQKAYGDHTGKKCYEYFMGRDNVCPGCGLTKALKTKQVTVTEKVLVKEDNRQVQVTTIPFQNEKGQWLVAEAKIDITNHRKIEQQLSQYRYRLEELINKQTKKIITINKRLEQQINKHNNIKQLLFANEQLLRMVLDTADAGIMVIDKDFHCTHYNRAMENILKISRKRIINKKTAVWEHLPHHLAHGLRETIQKAMKGQAINQEDSRYLQEDGRYTPVTETFAPVRNKDGEIKGVVVIIRDITAARREEEVPQCLSDELEITLERLSTSNRQLRNLVQVAVHDLQAHFRAIENLAGWISNDHAEELDQNGLEKIALLAEKTLRINSITEQVSKYIAISRKPKNDKHVNLNTMLSQLVEQIAHPENVEIVVEDNLPVIFCQKTHIKNLFEITLKDALNNIPDEEPEITIGCTEEEQHWKFSITYKTTAPLKQPEKMLQMPKTLSPRNKTEARCIDFTTVRTIVELYNGTIWIETPDTNTNIICFTLPKNERSSKDAKLEAHIAC